MACRAVNPNSRDGATPHSSHAWEPAIVDGHAREKCLRCSKLNPRGGIPPWIRFWDYVDKGGPGGCWLWTGRKTHDGYGRFTLAERDFKSDVYAHVYAYFLTRGKLPQDEMELDHICEVRHCMFPGHLREMTQGDNVRRGLLKPTCGRGHAMEGANLYFNRYGRRRCKECIKINNKACRDRANNVRTSGETK